MLEVKADALEASFEAFEDDGVAGLKEELEQLKSKIAAGVIAAQRPALDGVKSAAATSFVDGYLRRGIESGLEMKALGSSSDAIGGYAVPEEIDAVIDRTLTAVSPIRAIANVVKVGSAGYRKLVTSGGTPSGSKRRGRRRTRRASPRSCRHRASSTPIRRRRSRCSTMRCSTSRLGWRTRSRRSSPAPRAWRS